MMMKQYWKTVLVSVGAGVLGVLVTLGAVHVWQDHVQLHAVIQWVVQVQAAQQKAQAPATK